MKRFIAAGLLAAGLFAFSTTDAQAQYYYGYSSYYAYPSYGYTYAYPSYSPGLSFNISYYDRDYRRSRYSRYGHGHGHHGSYRHHRRRHHGHGHHYSHYRHHDRHHDYDRHHDRHYSGWHH